MNPWIIVKGEIKQNVPGILALILLIAVALALGVGVNAQERAIRTGANQAADPFDIVVGAQGSKTDLLFTGVYLRPGNISLMDGDFLAALDKDERIRYAAPIGFGDSYQGYPIIGTIGELALANGPLEEGNIFRKVNQVVIGKDVKLEIGDRFLPVHGQVVQDDGEDDEEHHEHHALTYEVVGRLPRWNSPWDKAIMAPIEAVWLLHGLSSGHREDEYSGPRHGVPDPDTITIGRGWNSDYIPGVPAIAVKPKEIKDAYLLRNEFRRDPSVTGIFPAEVLLELYALMGNIASVLALFSVTTQILVIGSILITILIYLSLKKKSLAVLRALGAPKRYIFASVWLQIFLIILTGSLAGLAMGYGVTALSSRILSSFSGLFIRASIGPQEIFLVLIVLGAGSVLAVIPAFLIYRQSAGTALSADL